jgi:hypothetical protein
MFTTPAVYTPPRGPWNETITITGLFASWLEGSKPQQGSLPVIKNFDPMGTECRPMVLVESVTVAVRYTVLPTLPFTLLMVCDTDKLSIEYVNLTGGRQQLFFITIPIPLPDTLVDVDVALRTNTKGFECAVLILTRVTVIAYNEGSKFMKPSVLMQKAALRIASICPFVCIE